MSSHREAPAIAKDPVADSTDLYAFVSPDAPSTVTLIANYIPLEGPDGGPNFFEFGDDVLYAIYIDNDGDARPNVTYRFRFQTKIKNPNTFLYNTGPISAINSASWNRPQFYSVTRVANGAETVLGEHIACPPCNVGPRSTPSYAALAQSAIHNLSGSHGKVFAGQRQEGFYVDLGSIFDLGALRPFQNLHLLPLPAVPGVNGTKHLNVHSIALPVPIADLTLDGHSRGDHLRISKLHRHDSRRHASPEHGDRPIVQPEHSRTCRRRCRGLSEWKTRGRRCRDDRTARNRRCDVPAGQPRLHAGRCRGLDLRPQ